MSFVLYCRRREVREVRVRVSEVVLSWVREGRGEEKVILRYRMLKMALVWS